MTTAVSPIYDLSNVHFSHAEILTTANGTLKGQFVQFKTGTDNFEYIFPSEKYCFLPEEHKAEFWAEYKINGGVFDKMPAYIVQLGLDQIRKISIEPALV